MYTEFRHDKVYYLHTTAEMGNLGDKSMKILSTATAIKFTGLWYLSTCGLQGLCLPFDQYSSNPNQKLVLVQPLIGEP